ncbi:hypothetical protein RM553_12800 [Zunongwangia sp. F363]|uniref:Uncharacterized protein n=1 Tax=Autumnicola tepida TaxID=3075595 RepID=A0ABU3CBJ6_9FLAO|nr:hypothetical protein [Zunongwangia sp. F363]MDT0643714.1 hypothetical protein [Zunongwangia sp. F363]
MTNLLQIIAENSNAKSGITIVSLAVKAGMSITNLKNTLNELHRAGKIRVREGINAKLVFLKN